MNPVELVGLAEQTGLIGPLTHLVLRAAVRECSTWWDNGWPLRISVNLSARMLTDEDFPATVRATLAEHDLPPSALCLELTETTIMADEDRTIEVLERLQAIGVTVAIDDFGVGYSSLAYLARLPVGEIKIDKSFVLSMPNVTSDELIVRSVVDLAFNLGIPVVAEGVETPEARRALTQLGCQYAQGYLFSRPLPAADFAAWVTGHPTACIARPPQITRRPPARLAG
jgi:EAL domain-containing protein (putative c-di-GMP-specific phosphodiesterase class I)